MQVSSSHRNTTARAMSRPSVQAWRLLAVSFAVAMTAGLSQNAIAASNTGGPAGGPPHGMMAGDMHGMGGMHGKGGMHGMQGMGEGRYADRMLDAVNATPEQRAQVKQIMDAARTDMQTQHAAGRTLHEQQRALFAQPTVDARAVETLRQQMLAQHDQVSKRMTQAMLDTSRVLTPEQRKMLSDRMAQRRGMMERHRTERATLEKGKN